MEWLNHAGKKVKQLLWGSIGGDFGPIGADHFIPVNPPLIESNVVLGPGTCEDFEIRGWSVGRELIAGGWQPRHSIQSHIGRSGGMMQQLMVSSAAGTNEKDIAIHGLERGFASLDRARLPLGRRPGDTCRCRDLKH